MTGAFGKLKFLECESKSFKESVDHVCLLFTVILFFELALEQPEFFHIL